MLTAGNSDREKFEMNFTLPEITLNLSKLA